MGVVKHAFKAGIAAQAGVEFGAQDALVCRSDFSPTNPPVTANPYMDSSRFASANVG
jgi:hypothetical protein